MRKRRCFWLIEQTSKLNRNESMLTFKLKKKDSEYEYDVDLMSFFSENKYIQLVRYNFLWTHKSFMNVCLTIKTKRKSKKRLSTQFAYLLDWTSYELYSLFPCFFPPPPLSFDNYIEDKTRERKLRNGQILTACWLNLIS
jgi:hypothetical protein